MSNSSAEAFAASYRFERISAGELGNEARRYYFPEFVEEIERGALIVRVHPQQGLDWSGVFALGYESPNVLTGVYATPHAEWLCAVAGGYGFVANAAAPNEWKRVGSNPVVGMRAVHEAGVLLLWDFHTISGFTREARLWQTPPLTWEGLTITEAAGGKLRGRGWDAITDREYDFEVDLATGAHSGGARNVAR